MTTNRVLLVEDDDVIRSAATCATNVVETLKRIASEPDAVLSDLHMPRVGDGLTVVSPLRHAHPDVALLLSAFPYMEPAPQAPLQADEILVKPMDVTPRVQVIDPRVEIAQVRNPDIVSVSTILDRTIEATIAEWQERVGMHKLLMSVSIPPRFATLICLRSSRHWCCVSALQSIATAALHAPATLQTN
jgi:CheY-like chemotaxis protein